MKFAGYVAWILICKSYKYGEKIYYNSRDIEFFLGITFWRAMYILFTGVLPQLITILANEKFV